MLEGIDKRLHAIIDLELAEDAAEVVLDRLLANREPEGDLLVAEALGQQVKDFDLPLRELLEEIRHHALLLPGQAREFIQHPGGDGRMDE